MLSQTQVQSASIPAQSRTSPGTALNPICVVSRPIRIQARTSPGTAPGRIQFYATNIRLEQLEQSCTRSPAQYHMASGVVCRGRCSGSGPGLGRHWAGAGSENYKFNLFRCLNLGPIPDQSRTSPRTGPHRDWTGTRPGVVLRQREIKFNSCLFLIEPWDCPWPGTGA